MDLLKRLQKLANRKNERIVILGEGDGEAFVMIPLSEYEALSEPKNEDTDHDCGPMPGVEHKLISPPVEDEIKINIKIGKPEQVAKISQKFEDEERFYLEPLG